MQATNVKTTPARRRGAVAPTNGSNGTSTRIDVPAPVRARLGNLLNSRLADAMDLYSQTKHAHWNVKGPNFYSLHLLFDELAERVETQIDRFAERATALGGVARGTIRMASATSSLEEFPGNASDGTQFVHVLSQRFAAYGNALREAIRTADEAGDACTADLFTEACRATDQGLYFLEAHLRTT